MENHNERSFVLSESMDRIYAYNSDRAEAMALLHGINDYIQTYGFCAVIDLEHFGVDISMACNKAPWSFSSNWGWMADMPCDDVSYELDDSLEHTKWIIWLGKPVEITGVTQQPESKRKVDCLGGCNACEYRCTSLFDEPCRSCVSGSNFTPPIKESKGENKMNYTNYTTKPEDTPMLNNLKPLENCIDPNKLIPKRIWFNSHDTLFFTTVQWRDGTKTTVSIPEDEHATEYSGFTAALAKKIFGTTGALKCMELAVERAKEPARRKAAQREELKRARQQARELQMELREDRIKREMEQERIRREAQRRLHKEELNETFTKVFENLNKALKGGKK